MKSTPSSLSDCKLWCKIKILKKPNLCIFGLEFENIICHVSNQRPRICFVAKFGGKIKILKFRVKNALFGYFWAGIFLKNGCHIWNQDPLICLIANFAKKQKCLNLGPKMCYSVIFGLEFEKNVVIFEISTWICLTAKYHEIMKMPIFGTKSALFGYFWARMLKNYCHIWNSTFKLV